MVTEAFDRANVEPYCTAADLSAVASETLAAAADSEVEYYTLCFEAAAEQTEANPENAPAVGRAYKTIGGHSAVELLPDTKAVLRELREIYMLGLVTNGLKEIQQKKVETLGIGDFFDTIVFATPEKGYKPELAPFKYALSDLNAAPDEAVHVGDSLQADVAGANAAGLCSVWITQEEPPRELADDVSRPDQTIDTLHDLTSVL
jgi:putative hydrolase of the HAD superfamily